MPRKSFLSRVDSQRAISTSGKSKEADNFIRSLNKACGDILQFLIQRAPGMHNYKIKKGGRSKGKKRGFIARRIAK